MNLAVHSTPLLNPTSDAEPAAASRRWAVALGLVILIGIFVRASEYSQNRVFWIDEAVLADNIVRRSAAELMKPLDHHQVAPIGYLLTERLVVDAVGNDERSLRLLSLIAGVLSLPMFLLLCGEFLDRRGCLAALLLFAFSDPLIYYSSELKPYAIDVLAAITITWLAARAARLGFKGIDLSAMAVAAAGLAWLSLPSLFVAASAFTVLAFIARRTRPALIRTVVAGAIAIGSAALHYLLFMRHNAGSDQLTSYWNFAFMPLPPRSVAQLQWFLLTPFNYFSDPGGLRESGLALLMAVAGAVAAFRWKSWVAGLLVLPFVVTLIVSALRIYPFPTAASYETRPMGRIILFTLPLAYLLIAAGLSIAPRLAGRKGVLAMALAMGLLLVHPALRIVENLRDSGGRGDIRDAFNYLAEHRAEGEPVYVNWPVHQLALYYRHRIELGDVSQWRGDPQPILLSLLTPDGWTRMGDWRAMANDLAALEGRRIWVILSHEQSAPSRLDERFLLHQFNQRGRVLHKLISPDASLYHVELER